MNTLLPTRARAVATVQGWLGPHDHDAVTFERALYPLTLLPFLTNTANNSLGFFGIVLGDLGRGGV
jgi:hypothetical protein